MKFIKFFFSASFIGACLYLFFAVAIAGGLTACGERYDKVGENGEQGPKGNDGKDGVDGAKGDKGDPGINGTDGKTTLVNPAYAAPSVDCPNGGISVCVGLDDDRDGKLDPEEIDNTVLICNGANGQPGTNGTDGVDGADGKDGTDGKSALLKLVVEPQGANCTYGGTKILTGRDINNNGVLDTAEVESWQYVCNGAPGVDNVECHYTTANNSDDKECADNEVCGQDNQCKLVECPTPSNVCQSYTRYNHACVPTTEVGCCLNNSQCSGSQVCSADHQCVNVTSCDDQDYCTTDSRNSSGTCVNADIANCCHNNGECATGEVCNETHRCELSNSCAVDADCDDGNPATVEVCNAAGQCDRGDAVEFVKIRVLAPSAAEIHLFYGKDPSNPNNSQVKVGMAPFSTLISREQICVYGFEIAARVPSGFWPWWGCDAGTSSKSLFTVYVNDHLTDGDFAADLNQSVPLSQCAGQGEGNLLFHKGSTTEVDNLCE